MGLSLAKLISREKHCVCRALSSSSRLPPPPPEVACHVTTCARPFSSRPAILVDVSLPIGVFSEYFHGFYWGNTLGNSLKLRYLNSLYLLFILLSLFCLRFIFLCRKMANVCARCKRPMSLHDDHAVCPQCRVAAGLCTLDVQKPCSICEVWTPKKWGKLRRSLADARARASQRGKEHWTAAFPHLVAWITARPASASSSGPASEISSLVSGDDFDDDQLVSMPNPQIQQVLVVQAQNGVNMASGMATTAPSTATTAPSTAPLPLTAGQSSAEPLVPIVVQIEAQDTPSVI